MKPQELKKYFDILCNGDYPLFINRYLKLEELKRIDSIGMFCGADYTNIFNNKFWYSRLDHSISTALITWNFTKDKTQTLAALFHDLGTPCFSHCVDFMMGDTINQESSEKDIFEIISESENIMKLLKEDRVEINDLRDIKKYPIVENKSPKLCADRLDGILSPVLIWLQKTQIEDIASVYKDLTVLENEDNILEIGFKTIEKAEKFFDILFIYSIALQSCEDKFLMQYVSDALKELVNKNKITVKDLYNLKERDIVNKLRNEVTSWKYFEKAREVKRTNNKPDRYYVSVDCKKRYVVPLCLKNNKVCRLDTVSTKCGDLLNKYLNYEDSKYCYVELFKEI